MSKPVNSITEDQNTQHQLDRLAAQRHLYARAKQIMALQLVLTLVITIMWSILVAIFPNLRIWAAFYAICVSILDAAVFDSIVKSVRQRAVLIQELFDCDVLHLEWPVWKAAERPDPEVVHEAAAKYKLHDPSYKDLLNWYPMVVGNLPLHIARIVCQRSNLRFDMSLRHRYSIWIIIAFSLFGIVVFGIGLIGGMSLEKFLLAVLAPISPAFLWGIRELKSQSGSMRTLKRLKNYFESLWTEVSKNRLALDEAKMKARHLQDGIFEHREASPLIFDWVYNRLRREHEEQMQKGAEELAREALGELY